MNTIIGTDSHGRRISKRCRICKHKIEKYHRSKSYRDNKVNGYCMARYCYCPIPLEDLI